jgi:hypothetical protein
MTAPNHRTSTADSTEDGFLSHQQMREHLAEGRAVPLSRLITDHAHYNNTWWLADRAGWHQITDDILIAKLNNLSNWVDGNLYLGGHTRLGRIDVAPQTDARMPG